MKDNGFLDTDVLQGKRPVRQQFSDRPRHCFQIGCHGIYRRAPDSVVVQVRQVRRRGFQHPRGGRSLSAESQQGMFPHPEAELLGPLRLFPVELTLPGIGRQFQILRGVR